MKHQKWIRILPLGIVFIAGIAAGETWQAPSGARTIENPLIADLTNISRGRELYQRNCEGCHGRKGRGNGPDAADLDRKPTDLTSPTSHMQTDGALFWKITEGRRPMPGYRSRLSDVERWSLIVFLRSLQGSKNAP